MNKSSLSNAAVPRIIRLLAISLLAVLLQACSAIKLGYNKAPELGYWWLDAYVDFSDPQSLQVRAELDRLLLWHRTQELPKIAALLHKAQRLAAQPDMAPEPVCALFADARERFFAVTTQAESAALALATSLGAEQINHIERKFAKNNLEWREEWLSGSLADRFERRVTANAERAEQFYGRLEDRQLAVLRARMEASVFDPNLSYAERVRRQQDLLQTLRQTLAANPKPSPAALQVTLRAYLDRANNSPNPVQRSYGDKLVAESCQTFAELHNSTTKEQRERAVRRLAAYERDAMELSSQR